MRVNSVNQNNYISYTSNSKEKDNSKHLKTKVMATSLTGVAIALALISKKQGFSLSPKKIFHTPVKDWAIFKIYDKKAPDRKLLELEEKEIITLATASVAGGLAGGIAFDDKKNKKAKLRESLNQILGNVLAPVACVGGVSRIYKKHSDKITSIMPQFKRPGKFTKTMNSILKALPGSFMTLGALACGIFLGNKISNFINEKIYKKDIDRKIKYTDFAPHVDDISMAITLMAKKSALSTFITRTVPAFLCVPGVQTGMAKED